MKAFCENRGSHNTFKKIVVDQPSKADNNAQLDWPSNAFEGVGYPLVKKGTNFISDMRDFLFKPNDKGRTLMDEFVKVYKDRPDKVK